MERASPVPHRGAHSTSPSTYNSSAGPSPVPHSVSPSSGFAALSLGPGRKGGPSILVTPDKMYRALSPDEVAKRLGSLQLFESSDALDNAAVKIKEQTTANDNNSSSETECSSSNATQDLLRETQLKTHSWTPQKEFDEFLARRMSSGDIAARHVTEHEFAELYSLGHFLGEGATSSVRYAVRRSDNAEVAVKIIKASLMSKHRGLLREVSILSRMHHPNIIRLYQAYFTDENLYVVTEFAHGEQLFDSIVRMRSYCERDARQLVRTILEAVAYLHEQNVAHRDLKPENIIYDEHQQDPTKRVKIVDFGFAGCCFDDEDGSGFSTPGGTPGFKAPDMLFDAHYGKAVDVWSVGVITYILLCGFPPFFSDAKLKTMDFLSSAPFWFFINKDTEELKKEIHDGQISFPSPFFDHVSETAKDFVCSLLKLKKEERLTAKQALCHKWMLVDASGATSHDERICRENMLVQHLMSSSDEEVSKSLQNLPTVVSLRTQAVREKLEELLKGRPPIQALRDAGIYLSNSSLPPPSKKREK